MEELKNEHQASKKKKHKNEHKNDSERTRKSASRLTTGQKKSTVLAEPKPRPVRLKSFTVHHEKPLRRTDSQWDKAATWAGCRRCPGCPDT